jgi:hypothetical protein
MNFCPNCGVAVQDAPRFCSHCGVELSAKPAPEQTTPAEAVAVIADLDRDETAPATQSAGPLRTAKAPEPSPKLDDLKPASSPWKLFKPVARVTYQLPGQPEKSELVGAKEENKLRDRVTGAGGVIVNVDDSEETQAKARKTAVVWISVILGVLAVIGTVIGLTSDHRPAGWSGSGYSDLKGAIFFQYGFPNPNLRQSWVNCMAKEIAKQNSEADVEAATAGRNGGDDWRRMRVGATEICDA